MSVQAINQRKPQHKVDSIFPSRWSPRAMSGEDVSPEELMTLFEAARWAPSCFNNQPWRFLYARHSSPQWQSFLDLLVEGNKVWAHKAGVLVVVISKKTFDHNGKPNRTHSYDTGAAWGYFALQGFMSGLAVHGMAGFDYEKARKLLNVSEDHQVEAMAAIGRLGRKEDLPSNLQEREFPSDRKSIDKMAWEGEFPRQQIPTIL